MLVIDVLVRIVLIVFLEVASFEQFNANSRSCYEVHNKTICYFQPNETYIEMTWDDAWNVCKENNSTLPAIENRMIAETLRRYLESKNSLPIEMWLAGREIRMNDWQWLNGKLLGRQSDFKEPALRYNLYTTNAVIKGLQFQPHYNRHAEHYICHITDSELCRNKSIIPWKNGCLFINNGEQLNLVDARNRCLDEGGDLATFEEDEDLEMLRKHSSLLAQNKSYWIGLRLNWWIWNETDSSKEIKYSSWRKYENLQNQECLYIHFIDYKWNQDHCTAKKPFICHTVNTAAQRQGTDDAYKYISVAIIGSIIAVIIVAVIIVIFIVTLKIRRNSKTRQQQNDATCVQTDGFYQDLRRGQDNMRSNDPYMELGAMAHQETEPNADYEHIPDYDDVATTHVPNRLSIVI